MRKIFIVVEEVKSKDEVIGAYIMVFEEVNGVREQIKDSIFIASDENYPLKIYEMRCYYEDEEKCLVNIVW